MSADAPTDRPAPPAAKPRRSRRRELLDEGGVFGSFTPWKNPPAVYSYAVALAGLTPVLGLLLGPAAIVLGLVGQSRLRRDPEIKGLTFIRAGIVLGTLDFIVNVAGVTCILIGSLGG
ncbi:MAG TPA: DUF4190 domain-containing protein [Gemmataceae bacterium]|jgi:hypothetical protein|nr:DUF4190 domain-containing protein [Gemmataceae bacterium]